MNENNDLLPNLLHEEFEMQMRGYSRRQVDEYVTRRTSEIRDLEGRLARALDESEHLRREISTVRQQALAGRPAHEEVSERISQILKLADDEAHAQRDKADEEISGLRGEAQQEADRVRADAREQAERMLTAAQEQAERTISAARSEADKMRNAARTESERVTSESRQNADATVGDAKASAQRMLDEATARATAIHDGAERRLNLLSSRHTETVRRLTDILEGVQGLVGAENARMSLEDEVNHTVANAIAALEPPKTPGASSRGTLPPSSLAESASANGAPAPTMPAPIIGSAESLSNSGPIPSAGSAANGLPGGGAVLPGGPVSSDSRPAARHSRPAQPDSQDHGPSQDYPMGSVDQGLVGLGQGLGLGNPEQAGERSSGNGSGPSGLGSLSVTPFPIGSVEIPPTMDRPGSTTSQAGADESGHQAGAHLPPPPPPPAMPTMPRRLGPDSGAQNALSLPSAPPVSGSVIQGPPPPDLEEVPSPQQLPTRDGKQDSNPLAQGSDPLAPGGYIDPDEPTEGVRLMR
jgi:cell division septum initiation protein DivIVA